MKKLLFLTAAMAVVLSVNAQVLQTQQSVVAPTTLQKAAIEMIVAPQPSPIQAIPMVETAHKDGYTALGWLQSGSFAANIVSADSLTWGGSLVTLFPDSIAFYQVFNFTDLDSVRADNTWAHSAGFVFDPYSTSFDTDFEKRLIEDSTTGQLLNYKIDTIQILGEYRMNIPNPAGAPDTLRVYVSQHDACGEGQQLNRGTKYGLFTYTSLGASICLPKVAYPAVIPEKGAVTKPNATSTRVYDYILSDEDSTVSQLGYVGYRSQVIVTDYPVTEGNIVSIVAQFVPGYQYDKNDTLRYIEYNTSTQSYLSDVVRKNVYALACYTCLNSGSWINWMDMGSGYNTSLLEDNNIRYGIEDAQDITSLHYSSNYFRKPKIYFHVSTGTDAINGAGVTDNTILASAIYPNPAQGQLNINLVSNEPASVELFNVLGQKVVSENLNTLSNTIDINGLAAGVYVVKVAQSGKTQTSKVTVK